jgi:hypothetical protein
MNTAVSAQQQSPQVNTMTTIVSPYSHEMDVDVVMVDAEEDNDGFDVVGSLLKCILSQSQQGNIWSNMISSCR